MLQLYRTPPAPKHLSAESRQLWKQVTSGWELDEGSVVILLQALEALDRLRQAQEVIAREGIVAIGRNGEPITHPAFRIEKDARSMLLRAWRQLDLEESDELPARIGRPPGGRRR
jgi:P27 family predicted phage terminase small subunit